MNEDRWSEVDRYFSDLFVPGDPELDEALRASADAGLPEIQVSPLLGKFLHLLTRIHGARRVLEIGTLGGYSTIWLARALPSDGRLVSLEARAEHAEVAARNLEGAGVSDRVEIRVGPALETLPSLAEEGPAPFDLVFIDADKRSNPGYLDWAIRLGRVGTLIVTDNVVRDGAVLDAASDDADVLGVRRHNRMIAEDPRLEATALQTVGVKGYDGFSIALVVSA
jgi:predicted O-methyltransferase YrrM